MKKRSGFLLIFLAVLMLFTAACGSTSNKKSGANQNDTITYQDVKGEVKLPKDPKRIVLLAESYYGDLVTLGKTPIAATAPIFKNPFYKGKTDGVKNLGPTPSVEKVAALKPDMIIAWGEDEKFDQYKKIAPTVAIKYNQYSFKDQLKEFGKMTGTPKKAAEWITKWDTKIAEVKPKVTKAVGSKTVSIVSPFDKGIYIFGNTFARGGEIIYDELKLRAPKAVKKTLSTAVSAMQTFPLKSCQNTQATIFSLVHGVVQKVKETKCMKAAFGHHCLLYKINTYLKSILSVISLMTQCH